MECIADGREGAFPNRLPREGWDSWEAPETGRDPVELTQALAFEPMHSGYVRVMGWRIKRCDWHARETGAALRFRRDAPRP